MKYELAKELKDAGFPHDWCDDSATCWKSREMVGSCVPTLEELIEACGAFESLKATTGYSEALDKAGEFWTAAAFKEGVSYSADGITPTEAIARLWLALQKK